MRSFKNSKTILLIFTSLFVVVFSMFTIYKTNHRAHADTLTSSPEIWSIRSIDTMKTSRDNARSELNNPAYDTEIKAELTAIKNTGANYVTVDTPYDNEFLPYLTRWVDLARQEGLHVWFRGNWSNWEGWFNYPKNMTPEQHIQANTDFIISHPDLFQDGDIFDPCPECENAGFWPQPQNNQQYNTFIQQQVAATTQAFGKIHKNVYSNIDSVIGGRAKDVFDSATVNSLNGVVSIDHYFTNPQLMTDFVQYFANTYGAKVVVSEFGAPIPDLNGDMTDQQQADFIQNVFQRLYAQSSNVLGVNYYVIEGGTTGLLHDDGTPKPSLQVVTDYFSPNVITGLVTDTLGNPVSGVTVKTQDGYSSVNTDQQGNYALAVPQMTSASLSAEKSGFSSGSATVTFASGSASTQNFTIVPTNPDWWYSLQNFVKNLKF